MSVKKKEVIKLTKLKPLQTEVSEECKKILIQQKKLQRKTMGLIIEELVMKQYGKDDK